MITARVATIGFTRSTARSFFERLMAVGVRTVLDVRLHNRSQLAGFAKSEDLAYFLDRIAGVQYRHEPLLTPTETMLKSYRADRSKWQIYRGQFLALMREREIEKKINPADLDGACLLCSEADPEHCHRTFVCEYLNERWGGRLTVQHI